MSQEHNIKRFYPRMQTMTDKDRMVYAYHRFEEGAMDDAIVLLNNVSQTYYVTQLHKDLSRALLCHSVAQNAPPEVAKEAEFYLVVYRLTKTICGQKMQFNRSNYFYDLAGELFAGFQV